MVTREQIVEWLNKHGIGIDDVGELEYIDKDQLLVELDDLMPVFQEIHSDSYAQGRHDALRGELPR
jgi:hypothetical protein